MPLTQSISDIVQKAHEQGWIADLVREGCRGSAAERHPARSARSAAGSRSVRAAESSARSLIDRPSLLCGRAPQWNEVCQVRAGRGPPGHPGAGGTWPGAAALPRPHPGVAHARPLAGDGDRSHWRDAPDVARGDESMRSAIALDTTVDGVAQVPAGEARLPESRAVASVYRSRGSSSRHFIDYYTKWLPERVCRSRPRGVAEVPPAARVAVAGASPGFPQPAASLRPADSSAARDTAAPADG